MSGARIRLSRDLRRVLLPAALSAFVGVAATAADGVDAVTTPGSGELTLCRSYLMYNSCDQHRVILPERIAVGDKLKLTYGSNPKNYSFHVVGIRRDGENCAILSDASGGKEDGEKIDVNPCQPAVPPSAQSR